MDRRHHHDRRDDDEDRRPPPPVQQHGYGREEGYGHPAPPRSEQYGYGGPPPAVQHGYAGPPPAVQHGYGAPPPAVQHGYGGTPPAVQHGYGAPQQGYGGAPAAVEHVSHTSHHIFPGHGSSSSNDPMEKLMKQPTVRIYCKANENVSLAVRGGTVLLATTNKHDESQHWIKDQKYSTKVKDEEGYPAFSLINKATKQALKHSLGQSHPVLVTEYNPEKLDESVLWTESRDVGDGYRCIRMVNNIYLNFDGFHGDKQHGGVRDGTTLDLWKWTEGDNQRWKIVSW
ncbi:hypothetical protein LUZ60_004038 [Juncus effusus]|nr:hypothetical protein LUZ60_004038 [Juncus effusus]